jgi:glutathione S-transferase
MRLYHSWPCGHSAIALIGLHEKGLRFDSRYVELRSLEQYSSQFLALNPHGQVPVLCHNEATLSETTALLEYLEDTFPTPRLMPGDAVGRWRVRVWGKMLNEDIAPSVSLLAWHTWTLPTLGAGEREKLRAAAQGIPIEERRAQWVLAMDETRLEEQLQYSTYKLRVAVSKVEKDLAQDSWLAGSQYSLADIYLFPVFAVLPRLLPEIVNPTATPRTMDWLAAVRSRPGVRSALSTKLAGAAWPADPLQMFMPGPEHVRWG